MQSVGVGVESLLWPVNFPRKYSASVCLISCLVDSALYFRILDFLLLNRRDEPVGAIYTLATDRFHLSELTLNR